MEGGGQDSDLLRSQCRQGFHKFAEAAGVRGVGFVSRGGRNEAHSAFCTALSEREMDSVVLLLVDSEEAIPEGLSNWEHLASRHDNELRRPEGASEENLFLMVQCMETWFIADVDCLKQRFGHGFKTTPFKEWPEFEAVPKATVFDVLDRATADCETSYAKGSTSFEILGLISPERVITKCPNAARLLDRLRKHMEQN
ncbi:MAG: DUF4276 family protein [Fimbriimonas sp.]|nr:DUF4276 family protein [Fimbriimonas sp.]